LFVVQVRGREHIPSGSYLVVSNHLGWIDPFILMMVFPDEPRLYFIAKWEVSFDTWWKRTIIGVVGGVIPFSVGSRRSHEELMGRVCAVLRDGGRCGLFPEGRIGPEEGKLTPFMNGVGHLAIRAGVPVLPVALAGTSELYLGRRIMATIGEPLPLADQSLALKPRAEATVRRVYEAVEALLSPYHEPPGVKKRWRWLTRLM
jgi:1-acyl-sn-glycerol-3-phosphate acyltransferase